MSNRDIEKLERVTNEYFDEIRELLYRIDHFVHKSNKSTALQARNAFRNVSKLSKEFKNETILYFDK